MNPPKDYRTAEAKKWAEDFIPPETCGSIDDVQNAMEHLRDANSQLRHVAHLWRHVALDELRRRRLLGETVTFSQARFAEIRRIAKLHDAPANLFAAIDECAADGLRFPAESGAAVVAAATQPVVSNGHQDAEPAGAESYAEYQQRRGAFGDIVDEALATYAGWLADDDYDASGALARIMGRMAQRRGLYTGSNHPTSKSRQADTEPGHPAGLNAAQYYALGLITEEAGEASQLVGKAMRFGIDTPGVKDPLTGHVDMAATPRTNLEKELGDFIAAIDYAGHAGLIRREVVWQRARSKIAKLCDPASMDNLGRRLAPPVIPDHPTPDPLTETPRSTGKGRGS